MRSETALSLFSLLILSLGDLSWAFAEIRGCNRTIRNSVGWIRWTGRMGRCIVRIRAPLRDPQVIEVKVRRLQVGFLKEARCEGAYFQFSDNVDDPDDPETGRYCGHVTGNLTRLFLRRGPDLTIILSSDAQFASANPVIFSAQFSILPIRLAVERHRGYSASPSPTCPMECTVRNERRSCRLTSPGYPSVYPRGIRCRVALESSAGRFRIGGQPEDLFDLMNYTDQESCQIENCEDALEPKGISRSFPTFGRVARDVETDESVIEDTRESENKNNGQVFAMERDDAEKTSGQLTRRRYHEKKATLRYRGRQYHREELVDGSNAGEPRLRIKSMRSKITRKDQRRVVPNRYLNGDSEGPNEMVGGTKITGHKYVTGNRSSGKAVRCAGGGDYLALLENVNGKIVEISRFCGSGRVPRIYSRGRNVILEFLARHDGTVTHDGFQVTLQEERVSQEMRHAGCEFLHRSTDKKGRRNIKSPRNWYPPSTVCTYKFLGRTTEKVSVHIKIFRGESEQSRPETERSHGRRDCPGNEITVYDGAQANGSLLMWSYCDASHWDINNIQVPLMSSGNELLIRYYSAKGSYDGQEFTYVISYRFIRKGQNHLGGVRSKYKSISLRPANLSTLNLNDTDNYNCDNRIGTFKNWFAVLVVFGVVSFIGAIITIITLTAKCLKIKSTERKLLQNAKQ